MQVEMNETVQHFEDWPYKWLSCLLLGTLTMMTSITALLGIISEPWLAWKDKILMSLLLHPMNFTLGFVVMVFSMASIQDIVTRPMCVPLVRGAVTSQWGVIISTLAICLGRACFLLMNKRLCLCSSACSPMTGSCLWVVSALIVVVYVYSVTLTVSHTSLPMGSAYEPDISDITCTQFFTSVEAFPRTVMGFSILCTNVLVVISLAIIITHIKKRRSLLSVGIMRAQDLIRLQPLAVPPDERARPIQENLAANPNPGPHPEHANDVNINARSSMSVSRNENQRPNVQNLQDGEFYDDEQLRHRAQSPPPEPDNMLLNVNPQFFPVPHAGFLPFMPVNQPLPVGANDGNPNRDDVENQERFILPAAFLDVIFPHRETRNKPRFSYTKVQHTREFSWPIVNHDGEAWFGAHHDYPVDQVICASCFLYIISYTPLACYLLYTSGDPAYQFTDQSFEFFISLLLVKASLDSFLHFTCMQMFPCLQPW